MKQYSFFYHYFKQNKCMSVHFKGVCHQTPNVECRVSCETKWNKTQPYLIMKGRATDIEITPEKIIIK